MKKRRKLKIFLIVLAVILAFIAGLIIWQWNNVNSFIYFLRYSEDDLNKMMDDNKNELNTALSSVNIVVPRELTEEEINALEEGIITEEDAVEISLGITTLEEKIQKKDTENTTGANTENNVSSQPASKEQEGASYLIAQLYVLKSSYMSKLDGLEAQAKSEYASTPAEQRTAAWKSSMMSKYAGKASALEGECDAKVESLIAQIKEELSKTGGDTSIINTIRSTYENEKQIKKAHYMNTYLS